MFKRTTVSIFICLFFAQAWSQDRLLLTNGKIKELDGIVVYYDHDDVLFQNDAQRERMKKYVAHREAVKNAKESNPRSKVEKQRDQAAEAQRQKAREENIDQRTKDFEEDALQKLETLSPADFEKWKSRELAKIKSLEQSQELNAALDEQLISAKQKKKEARERGKFTTRIARDLVFSILKSDSSEVVVYSADTLGFLSEGDPEVDYGVTEMRAYIAGRQAGRNHNTNFDVVLGVGVGVISAAVGSFWGPSIPAGTVIVTSIANTKIKNKAGIDPALLDNPAFRDGYDRSAKRKKAWNFVKGSIAGLGFGLLIGDGIFRNRLLPGPR